MPAKLNIAFEGPGVSNGVSLSDLNKTLSHIQTAARLTAERLAGNAPNAQCPPIQTRLRAAPSGNIVAELAFVPQPQADSRAADNAARSDTAPSGNAALNAATSADAADTALDAILNWRPDSQPDKASALPETASRELQRIGESLPPDISAVKITAPNDRRQIAIPRAHAPKPNPAPNSAAPDKPPKEAVVYGDLMAVDWTKKTARLHLSAFRKTMPLRFDADMDAEMRRFTTRYVRITGEGNYDADGDLTEIKVKSIQGERHWSEPFDIEAFLARPQPKILTVDDIKPLSEPFDVEEFNRSIRRGRDA